MSETNVEYFVEHPEKISLHILNVIYDNVKNGLVSREEFGKMLRALAEYLIKNINNEGKSYEFVFDVIKLVIEELGDKELAERLANAVVGYLVKHPEVIYSTPAMFKNYMQMGLISEQQFKEIINAITSHLLNNPDKAGFEYIYYLSEYIDVKTIEKLMEKYLDVLEKDRKKLNYLRNNNITMELRELVNKGLPQQLVDRLRELIEGKKELEPVLRELEKEGIKVKTRREGITVYIAPEGYLSKEKFQKYIEILKRNGFKYSSFHKLWFKEL